MELRHIRYFMAIAEEKNFTRAAARLGIGQPPLSQQIKDLEAEVGAQLFHRVPYGAELTEAGRVFFERVKDIPLQTVEAVHAAQRASRGETGRLNLGFTGTAALNPVVPACIREFRRAYPNIEINLEEASSLTLLAGLQANRLDAAILRPSESDPPELSYLSLASEPLIAALPADHPAAGKGRRIDLSILRNDPFILTPPDVGISLRDAVLAACKTAGFEPMIGQPAPQIVSILSMVAAEQGVSVVPSSMRQLSVSGVVFRDLRGVKERIGLSVAIQRTRPPEPAKNFVKLALEVSRNHSTKKQEGRPRSDLAG